MAATDAKHEEHVAFMEDLAKRCLAMHVVEPRSRNKDWIHDRRLIMQELHTGWACQVDFMDFLRDEFAMKVRALMEGVPAMAAEALELADFTNDALDRLRAKEEREGALPASGQGSSASGQGASASGQGASASSASGQGASASSQGASAAASETPLQRYLAYFLEGTGRDVSEGALGAWAKEPALSQEQRTWGPQQWAMFWLRLGGFEPSQKGADATDADGFTPLHHAIQATVYWSKAHDVVEGLVPIMTASRLRAKTTGGRPSGYTAMHLAANGSDRLMIRHKIVRLLCDHGHPVDVLDEKGRTPLLLACGTGVLDTVKALVACRADVRAKDVNGKNAMDKAFGSSGMVSKYLQETFGLEPSGGPSTRFRPQGKSSASRNARTWEWRLLNPIPEEGDGKGKKGKGGGGKGSQDGHGWGSGGGWRQSWSWSGSWP